MYGRVPLGLPVLHEMKVFTLAQLGAPWEGEVYSGCPKDCIQLDPPRAQRPLCSWQHPVSTKSCLGPLRATLLWTFHELAKVATIAPLAAPKEARSRLGPRTAAPRWSPQQLAKVLRSWHHQGREMARLGPRETVFCGTSQSSREWRPCRSQQLPGRRGLFRVGPRSSGPPTRSRR